MSTTLLQLEFQKFLRDTRLQDIAKYELKEYHESIEYDQLNQMEEEEYNWLLEEFILNYTWDNCEICWYSWRLRLANEIDKDMNVIVLPLTPPDYTDTVGRDDLDRIMNDLTRRYFGYFLVTCPECQSILKQYNDMPVDEYNEEAIPCPVCKDTCPWSECPDLFF